MNTAQQAKQETLERVTHIEIRRVQNGFVVMGLDYSMERYASMREEPQRISYVAKDVEDLKRVIESIVHSAEVKWLPTVDIPMLEMRKREISESRMREREQLEQKAMEQARQSLGQLNIVAGPTHPNIILDKRY